jgi:hypothetical protein
MRHMSTLAALVLMTPAAGFSQMSQSDIISDITTLEVSNGTHTGKAKGALWGLLIGAGNGAILGYTMYTPPKCDNQGFGCIILFAPDTKANNAAFSAAAGGVFGISAGTLFGMRSSGTRVPGTVGAR